MAQITNIHLKDCRFNTRFPNNKVPTVLTEIHTVGVKCSLPSSASCINSSIWETIPHILHGHGTLTNWSPKCTLYIAIIPMDLDLEGCEFLPNLYSLQFSIRFRKPVSPNITQKKTTFPVALLSRKHHTDTHTRRQFNKKAKNIVHTLKPSLSVHCCSVQIRFSKYRQAFVYIDASQPYVLMFIALA